MNEAGLGYPARTIVALATALALPLVYAVLPLASAWRWGLASAILLAAIGAMAWITARLAHAEQHNAKLLSALGHATTDLPRSLRTRMPLLLVIGDGLPELFPEQADKSLVHLGNGAIWVRVDRPQDMPPLAAALRRWRDGRAPDGVVLTLAPALHPDDHALTHSLRLIRQAGSDTARLLGTRIPAYLVLYQRLTSVGAAEDGTAPPCYGIARDAPLNDTISNTAVFEAVLRCSEADAQRAHAVPAPTSRAAALPALIDWTRSMVVKTLMDHNQPGVAWPLFGIGWIDCGPASNPHAPWSRYVRERTHLALPHLAASVMRWPLPLALVAALPRRRSISPRLRACAHAGLVIAAAVALAGWAAAHNNHALLAQAGTDMARFADIPASSDAARRDALVALTADRDRLERYQRTGVPLSLGFGMYRGATVLSELNTAIASYQPTPAIVTLDSLSLFASGQARLMPGSTRVLVAALELIKAHPHERILVAGHTDNLGAPADNQRLSVARAGAVRDWLMDAANLPPSRFAIQGYGESRPLADNRAETGRARNRRVEITLVPEASGT